MSRWQTELTRLLAVGWAVGLTAIYLFWYDGWPVPLALVRLAAASVHTLGIGPDFAGFVIGRSTDLLCVLAIMAAAFGLGAVALTRLLPRRDLLGALFALAVGLWALAVTVLVAGAISVPKIPLVFSGLACWLLPAPRRFFGQWLPSSERFSGWARLMLCCVGAAALLNMLGAMAPPLEYDELVYHLGAPADYIRAGRIAFLPHNLYSNFPQLTEMLYLLAILTSSDVAAKLLHWTFGLLSALGVYAVAARLWTNTVGVTAAALFYCTPFVLDLSQTARVELASTFFATMAIGGLLVWWKYGDGDTNQYLWLSALAAGGAVATKWTLGAVVLLPLLATLIATGPRCVSSAPSTTRFLALRYLLLAAAGPLPWLMKNLILAGNPVYPFLHRVFPSSSWSPAQATVFAEYLYPTFNRHSPLELFERAWQYSLSEPWAVPLLLMLTPLIVLIRNGDPIARRAAWLFVASYVGWFLSTFRPWRYLFPAFPLAALVGAFALQQMSQNQLDRLTLRTTVGVVLAVSLAAIGLNVLADVEASERVPPKRSFLNYALGQASRDDFVAQMGGGTLESVVWMNNALGESVKVLYVGEARVYYARHPVLWSTAFDQHPLMAMVREARSAEELLRIMSGRGVTHLYVHFSELQRLRIDYGYLRDLNWNMLRTLLDEHARVVHATARGRVYELRR